MEIVVGCVQFHHHLLIRRKTNNYQNCIKYHHKGLHMHKNRSPSPVKSLKGKKKRCL